MQVQLEEMVVNVPSQFGCCNAYGHWSPSFEHATFAAGVAFAHSSARLLHALSGTRAVMERAKAVMARRNVMALQ